MAQEFAQDPALVLSDCIKMKDVDEGEQKDPIRGKCSHFGTRACGGDGGNAAAQQQQHNEGKKWCRKQPHGVLID